jgi:NitT/TauT family transport system substrate-binding protein
MRFRLVGLAIIAVSTIVGCASQGSTAAPSSSGTAPSASAAAVEPSASIRVGPPSGQASTFTVAETAMGLGSVAFRAAIDELKGQGYTIETPVLTESELVSQGVASGQFQFGSGANSAALLAMEKGAAMKFVVDRNANEWVVVVTKNIANCEQLASSRVAIHSSGSVSGAMLRDWIKKQCPGSTFAPLIISGSQNRAAALLAGQIDGTPAELRDWIAISSKNGDDYKVLVDFAGDLPDLHPTSLYGNTEWITKNPDVTKDLVREIVLQHRRINSEPGYLLSLYQKFLPDEAADVAIAKLVTDKYVELGLFDDNGGLTTAAVDYTVKFFGPNGTGDLAADLPVDAVSDLSFLQKALAEVGTK